MTLPQPPSLDKPIPNSNSPAAKLRKADEPRDIAPQPAGVHSVEGGVGILLSGNTGKVKIVNTGVTSIVAGPGVFIDNATGRVTISSKSTGTVTSVSAGKGLAGGTIEHSGTISLAASGVQPGVYGLANIVVDEHGRITAATSGTALKGITADMPLRVKESEKPHISIDLATETYPGVLKVSNSVQSLAPDVAASSFAVKTAFDAAAAAVPLSQYNRKGDLLVAVAGGVPVPLPVGNPGDVLTVDPTSASGLSWKPQEHKGVSGRVAAGMKTLVIEDGIITRII